MVPIHESEMHCRSVKSTFEAFKWSTEDTHALHVCFLTMMGFHVLALGQFDLDSDLATSYSSCVAVVETYFEPVAQDGLLDLVLHTNQVGDLNTLFGFEILVFEKGLQDLVLYLQRICQMAIADLALTLNAVGVSDHDKDTIKYIVGMAEITSINLSAVLNVDVELRAKLDFIKNVIPFVGAMDKCGVGRV